ncbi:hypothetical protein BT69DRAFT_1318762 [Atractiella rhizophila]|nr:hypothetical protein BT69DRAFT_1318762 [Atractiella rhizophila]
MNLFLLAGNNRRMSPIDDIDENSHLKTQFYHFSSLPVELHIYLLTFCPATTHRQLSLTSQHLRRLSLPYIFRRITLSSLPWDLDVWEKVEDSISPHVRELRLEVEANWKGVQQLSVAIKKFRKLDVLKVSISLSSPEIEGFLRLVRTLFPLGEGIHSFSLSIAQSIASNADISLAETKLAWEFLQLFDPATLKSLSIEASAVVTRSVHTSLQRLNKLERIDIALPFSSTTDFSYFAHLVKLSVSEGMADVRTLVNVLKSCNKTLEELQFDRTQIFGWLSHTDDGEEERLEVLRFNKLKRLSWHSSVCMIMTARGNLSNTDFIRIFGLAPISVIFVEEKDSALLLSFVDPLSEKIALQKYEQSAWTDLKLIRGRVRNTSSWIEKREEAPLASRDWKAFGFEVKIGHSDELE